MFKFAVSAFALATAFAAPAAGDQIKIEEIAYNTADLTDATRLEALRSELRAAARRVCTVPGERQTLFISAKRDCIERAYNDALLQIENRVAELESNTPLLSVEVR